MIILDLMIINSKSTLIEAQTFFYPFLLLQSVTMFSLKRNNKGNDTKNTKYTSSLLPPRSSYTMSDPALDDDIWVHNATATPSSTRRRSSVILRQPLSSPAYSNKDRQFSILRKNEKYTSSLWSSQTKSHTMWKTVSGGVLVQNTTPPSFTPQLHLNRDRASSDDDNEEIDEAHGNDGDGLSRKNKMGIAKINKAINSNNNNSNNTTTIICKKIRHRAEQFAMLDELKSKMQCRGLVPKSVKDLLVEWFMMEETSTKHSQKIFDEIKELCRLYKQREPIVQVELCLWKAACFLNPPSTMNDPVNFCFRGGWKKNKMESRYNPMIGIIINNILPFLPKNN